jgi:hypothetical protein
LDKLVLTLQRGVDSFIPFTRLLLPNFGLGLETILRILMALLQRMSLFFRHASCSFVRIVSLVDYSVLFFDNHDHVLVCHEYANEETKHESQWRGNQYIS